VPWSYLAGIAMLTVAGLAVAVLVTVRMAWRPALEVIREL
jgi:hypothetical protein